MSAITRYIFAEMLKVFFVTLAGLTMLMVLVGVGQEAVRMNLGLMPTLRLIPYVLPNALAFAVPGTVLFTCCMIYGRMSADNEVVAVKAAGVSPIVLLRPAFALAFVLSLVTVWLIDVAYSWGHAGMQRVVIQSVEEIAYGMLRTQRSYGNKSFSIIVKDVEGRRLIRPIINFQANNDMPAFTLTAAEAELQSNLKKNTLKLILTNCEIDAGNGVQGSFPGTIEREIPLTLASTKETREGSPAHLPLRQIASEIEKQKETIAELEQALAFDAGVSMVVGEFEMLNEGRWSGLRWKLQSARERLHRLRTEPWRRWSSGFSCLCFVLVGAPLAIRMRTSDLMTTFGLCFGPILILYYPFFAYGLDRAKSGDLPPYTVWVANLVLATLGIWLIKKVVRY